MENADVGKLAQLLRDALRSEPRCEFVIGNGDSVAIEGEFNLASMARFLCERGVTLSERTGA